MTFLIVLLALVLLEAYSDLGSVQPDQWLRKWHQALSQTLFLERSSTFKVAGFVLLPLITVSLALLSLQHYGLGFFSLIAELLVLLYSLGRGNIDTQITLLDSDLGSEDLRKALNDAAVFDTTYREDHSESIEGVREAMFSALPYRLFERSFVVIFWFCLFGAPVALGYRLLALHGDMQLDQAADDNKNNENKAPNKPNHDKSAQQKKPVHTDKNKQPNNNKNIKPKEVKAEEVNGNLKTDNQKTVKAKIVYKKFEKKVEKKT